MDFRTRGRPLRLALAALTVGLGLLLVAPAAAQGPVEVLRVEARGAITQVTADHIADAIEQAEAAGAAAVVVELDTPGGGLETTRGIVRNFLASDVPVVVYVSPSGSRAGSAGTFITYAAHVAAMAPGTTIGAAIPVDPDGGAVVDKLMEDTVSFAESLAEQRGRNPEFAEDAVRDGRSITADTAVEIAAVDLIARDLASLLEAIDGEEVPLGDGGTVVLETAGATVTDFEMGFARSLLQGLANPQLAFIFITVGTLGIIYELANPGVGIGGVIGAIMLILAFYSLSVLPTNFAGVALLLLGMALLVAELFVPGVGVLAGGGALSLLFAGLLLFDRTRGISVSWGVLLPTVAIAAAGAVAIGVLAARERQRPSTIGHGMLVGREAEVRTAAAGRLQVFVDGELWDAFPAEGGGELERGQHVRVVAQDGLRLTVEPLEEQVPRVGQAEED